MKRNYLKILVLTSVFISSSYAQKFRVLKDDEPTQKLLKLEGVTSINEAISNFGKLYGLSEENTFTGLKLNLDIAGNEHQRFQQYFKGIKVEFGVLITHSKNGSVFLVNGELYNPGNINATPSQSAEYCFNKALYYCPSEKYVWEDAAESKAMDYVKPKGELVLIPLIQKGEVRLAYKFDMFSSKPISREEVYVDAQTGELLFKNPIIKHATTLISKADNDKIAKHVEKIVTGSKNSIPAILVTGTAATRYSGTQSIDTEFDAANNRYQLFDSSRGNGIRTYNSANTNTYPTTSFYDSNNVWNDGNYLSTSTTRDNAALDAHWAATKTYDFWKNIFGRNSFDDRDGEIKSYVHFNTTNLGTTGWDNAQWTGSVMRYGDGSSFNVLTSVDVIGHEIGHGVCQYTANLAYQNQSGAMNEGYSDIWGACIEQYARNGNLNAGTDTASPGTLNVWKIGEDLATNPLRSMSYPTTRNNPDTFKGTYYTTTADDGICTPSGTNDNCGVHNNSGVFNHWFYILTAGKAGTNNASAANGGPDTYNVTGIGMAKSSQIAYYTERDYLTANAKFTDARTASIAVASSLYCASSAEVKAVTDAWFAVNVGNAFAAPTTDVVLKSISGGNASPSCSATYNPQIIIENGGTGTLTAATITYNVDGGTNSTINWTGNLASCSQATQAITVTGLARGYHILNVTTTTTGDGNTSNNVATLPLVVNDAGAVNVTNPFTTAANNLVSIDSNGKTNTLWERGLVNKTPLTSAATGNSEGYVTKLTGNYPDKVRSYLVSQCYNLTAYSNPSVSFSMAFDLESNWDAIYFEYSTDNGATWNILGTASDPNWYNSSRTNATSGTSNDCQNCPGSQWTGLYATAPAGGTGVNGNLRNYSHTLTQFGFGGATPASNIIFRFNFVSDDSSNNTGVFIDNFVIQGTFGTTETQFEEFAIYPNPSNGKFNIKLSTLDDVKVKIFDIRGRSVYDNIYNSNGTTFNQELNLTSLTSGVYILTVESAGKKEGRRIIIE